MNLIDDLNKRKIPIAKIDPALEKLDQRVLFPQKLAKANELLKGKTLPRIPKP